ncbi:hypothetical protein VTN00DRAFT_8794 [Thermoascus crustaceus]|uniref:uncharacterized protein n=1 Tax=Thermoascus crustaceus TaxID=5088 RepID=UPI0037447B04
MSQQSQQPQKLRQPQQPQLSKQLQRRRRPQPPGLICPRCHMSFATLEARANDIEEPLDHNVCYLCLQVDIQEDFETFTELQDHLEKIHHYCEPCEWHCTSRQALRAHNISMHNMCAICEEYFQNVHELNGHTVAVHRPHMANCPLCSGSFTAYASVFNHLESDNCPYGATLQDIHNLATQYYQVRGIQMPNPFACRECPRSFNRLSDLMQHIDTRSCPANYFTNSESVGPMVTYIRNNLRDAVDAWRPLLPPPPAAQQEQQNAANAPAQPTQPVEAARPGAGGDQPTGTDQSNGTNQLEPLVNQMETTNPTEPLNRIETSNPDSQFL